MAVGGFQPMLNSSGTLPNLIPCGAGNWMRCDVFWLVFALPKFNQHTHVMHLQHPNFSPKFCSGVLDTPHSTLYTQHFTLDTLDTTFYTWHCTRLTPCWVTDCMSLHTVHSTCFKRPSIFPPVFNDLPSFFFLPFSCHSSIFPPLSTIFLPFLSFFSYLFHGIPPFSPCFQQFSFVFFLPFSCHSSISPPVFNDFPSFSVVFFLPFSWHSSIFPLFSTIFLRFFPTFFLHFPPVFNDFPSFSLVFSSLFLPESTDLGGIEAYRHLFA